MYPEAMSMFSVLFRDPIFYYGHIPRLKQSRLTIQVQPAYIMLQGVNDTLVCFIYSGRLVVGR